MVCTVRALCNLTGIYFRLTFVYYAYRNALLLVEVHKIKLNFENMFRQMTGQGRIEYFLCRLAIKIKEKNECLSFLEQSHDNEKIFAYIVKGILHVATLPVVSYHR